MFKHSRRPEQSQGATVGLLTGRQVRWNDIGHVAGFGRNRVTYDLEWQQTCRMTPLSTFVIGSSCLANLNERQLR